jgi:GNAT superfamily N-acetyltransferase
MIEIRSIKLPAHGLELLQAEANAEGYGFIERLVSEWQSGANRFEGPGEVLSGHMEDDQLVAVGGLNCDPFAGSPEIGRIRRIYVRPAWRKKGIGRALVMSLIEEARKSFHCVRLRAENSDAARLYESMGFLPIADPDATHTLYFSPPTQKK